MRKAIPFVLILLVVVVVASLGLMAQGPLPVPPGDPVVSAIVSGRCPNFHWTASAAAASVDIVVYRVPRGASEGPPQPVLSVSLPSSESGWTPSLSACLEPGSLYGWSVRASTDLGNGEWSEPSLFEISAAPSLTESQEAMGELRDYVEEAPVVIPSAGEIKSTVPAPGELPVGAIGQPPPDREIEVFGALSSQTLGIGPASPGLLSPSYSLFIERDFGLGGFIFKDGKPFVHNAGDRNTALGLNALSDHPNGGFNSAVGYSALRSNSSGIGNTALGCQALSANTEGSQNTAIGGSALERNATGVRNTAVGVVALFNNKDGNWNTALGRSALAFNESGNLNTALGYRTSP